MKKNTSLISLVMLLFVGFQSHAQVDPMWLKSWNEAVANRPKSVLVTSNIAAKEEPGQEFLIKGQVFNPDSTVTEGVLVHAYHRDARGFDFGKNDTEFSTWRLQGWAKTDENGFFEFRTIKPAADHMGREGAHIHFTTISDEYGKQWAPKVFFADDPLVSDAQRSKSKQAGKFNWVCEIKEANNVQYILVKIKLKDKKDF